MTLLAERLAARIKEAADIEVEPRIRRTGRGPRQKAGGSWSWYMTHDRGWVGSWHTATMVSQARRLTLVHELPAPGEPGEYLGLCIPGCTLKCVLDPEPRSLLLPDEETLAQLLWAEQLRPETQSMAECRELARRLTARIGRLNPEDPRC